MQKRGVATADPPTLNQFGATVMQVMTHIDKGVVSKHSLRTGGGRQMASFVNEDGLYDVILDSRKAEARAFRKWVFEEVLPQIRQTDGYIISQQNQYYKQ